MDLAYLQAMDIKAAAMKVVPLFVISEKHFSLRYSACLTEWVNKAEASGIRVLKSFAKTLARLRVAILAYYDFDGLSSSKIKGRAPRKTSHELNDVDFRS